MAKEDIILLSEVIEGETNASDKKDLMDGLKELIVEEEKGASADYKSFLSTIKTKFFGVVKKKRGRKASSLPKKATTAEEKAEKKAKVSRATGKSIDECKEILAKYEETRKAKNKSEKERLDGLEKKGDLIEGTNVKDAGSAIEDVSDDVKKKIEKEVDQFEKKAEREAKKEVSTSGKSATEVKKEVAKKVSEKTEKELNKISKEMSNKASKFIKDIQGAIAKESKDDAKKFLLDVKDQIDTLLSAYCYGGEIASGVQSYKVAWMGGSPSMYEKGGEVKGLKPSPDLVEYLKNHTKKEAYKLNNLDWSSNFISDEQYIANHRWITEQIEEFNPIGKEVTVDFRKEKGIVKAFEDNGDGTYLVKIHYPSLGFTEQVNTSSVDVNFVE